MVDLFAVFLMVFFAVAGLYTAVIVYVVRVLRRLEDRVKGLEEVLK